MGYRITNQENRATFRLFYSCLLQVLTYFLEVGCGTNAAAAYGQIVFVLVDSP
jgi:hypothetical protein